MRNTSIFYIYLFPSVLYHYLPIPFVCPSYRHHSLLPPSFKFTLKQWGYHILRHALQFILLLRKWSCPCAPHHEGVWGSGCIEPHFLDLGTSWRWVVSFTPRPLYPWGKSPRYPLDRRLGVPQSRSGRRGEEEILDPTGTRTPTPLSSSP
jgi:hypothetical protein